MQIRDPSTLALELPGTIEDQDSPFPHEARPPVVAFDPYFGSRVDASEPSSEFDEMMWEGTA
jgi:hypothetical protein